MSIVRTCFHQSSKKPHKQAMITSFLRQYICCSTLLYVLMFSEHIYKGKMQHISYLLTLVSVPSRYLAAQLSSLHIRMNTNFPIYVASKSDGNMRYSNMPVKQGLDESSRASIQHTNTQQSSFQK